MGYVSDVQSTNKDGFSLPVSPKSNKFNTNNSVKDSEISHDKKAMHIRICSVAACDGSENISPHKPSSKTRNHIIGFGLSNLTFC